MTAEEIKSLLLSVGFARPICFRASKCWVAAADTSMGVVVSFQESDLEKIAMTIKTGSDSWKWINKFTIGPEVVDSLFTEDTPIKQDDLIIESPANTGKSGHCADKPIKFREFL